MNNQIKVRDVLDFVEGFISAIIQIIIFFPIMFVTFAALNFVIWIVPLTITAVMLYFFPKWVVGIISIIIVILGFIGFLIDEAPK